jgi:hypothetical protein
MGPTQRRLLDHDSPVAGFFLRVVKFKAMGNTTAAVTAMDKMLDQLSGCFNAEAARRIVELKIDAETQARVAALAEKANEGLLSADELEEYKSYVEVGDIIAILKLKARRLLASTNGV